MDQLIGATLGGCRIESRLGEGGMGIVYKAHHEALDIPVAIKILKSLHSSAASQERFLREARLTAKLRHQNIIGVLNIGTENNVHYIVMEFIEGTNLHELISQKGKLDQQQTLQIAFQILDALTIAHDAGIIHRDIKPENILIDKKDCIKLADLGLARTGADISLTQSSIMIGSPYYISPEQAENPRSADHRADIYSLGCTLFHAIAGKPPFDGTSPIEVILDHIRKPTPKLLDFAPDTNQMLSDIIYKMMQKDRELRFTNTKEAREALLKINLTNTKINPSHAFLHFTLDSKQKKSAIIVLTLIAMLIAIFGILNNFKTKPKNNLSSVKTSPFSQNSKNSQTTTPPVSLGKKTTTTSVQSKNNAPTKARDTQTRLTSPKVSKNNKHINRVEDDDDKYVPPGHLKKQKSHKEHKQIKEKHKGKQVTESNKKSNLELALENGEIRIAQSLLEQGIDPNVDPSAPTTPLHIAVHQGSLALVKTLLNHGANPNVSDYFGDTPLHYAIRDTNIGIVRMLLQHGANPRFQDRNGLTAFALAQQIRVESIKNLVRQYSGK